MEFPTFSFVQLRNFEIQFVSFIMQIEIIDTCLKIYNLNQCLLHFKQFSMINQWILSLSEFQTSQ